MATGKQIRAHFGHGEGSRKVRISRDGIVTYFGSRDPVERRHDYWHDGGTVDSISREIANMRSAGRPAELEGGKPIRVYLDAASIATASKLGAGNVSAGIRAALAAR